MSLGSKGEENETGDPHTFILFIWIIPAYIKLHFFLSLSSVFLSVLDPAWLNFEGVYKLFPYFLFARDI